MNRRWPALVVVLAAFLGLSGVTLAQGRFLHDEGLLTHLFALATARDPAATFFLQKSRPPISALYAPVAGSLDLFFWAHIVVGALGIVALWAAARSLGHARPWVAPAVMALSPMYIGGSVAGLSNTDVVAGACAFAWLYASDRRVAAAAVLGVLPWIRAEIGVLCVVVLIDAVRRRSWTEVGAMPAFGIAYGLAGIGYHHDPLWFLHYPPALPEPMPGNPFWAEHGGTASVGEIVSSAVALTPLIPALVWTRWRTLDALERRGLWFCAAFALALVVLPAWRVFNFDQSPRYLLPVLPFVALALGRGIGDACWRGDGPGPLALPALSVMAGLAYLAARTNPHPTALAAVAFIALALTVYRARWPWLAAAPLVVLAGLGPFMFADGGHLDTASTAPHLGPMIDRLEETVGPQPKVVYTNEPLLATALRRSGRLPQVTVFYIVQEDQRFELERLANPWVGQREALWDAMADNAYGRPIRPDALRPDTVPVGALFALTKDARLPLVMPPQRWDGLLVVLRPGYDMVISERVAGEGS